MTFISARQPKIINRDLIKAAMLLPPRRICFSSCHKDALKIENGEYLGKLSFPFKESIKLIFEDETGLTLFPKLDRYWHSIKLGHESDLMKIEEFIRKYQEIVFLRDCLDSSIALSENISDKDQLTKMGELEDNAKYHNDEAAALEIAEICKTFILNTPYYDQADRICAIPPSDPNGDNLPRKVVRLISDFKEKDVSEFVNWNGKKPPLKGLGFENKLLALDNFNLEIKTDVKNKSIIIIDDLYQSGTTMQYIAMKLKEAGASFVYGLSFVKARNDKDYV